MVNAGLLPVTIVNDWTAKLWSKLLPKMQVHSDIAIGPGVAFGWAVRQDSPKLLADINEFIKTHRQGTAFGNQLATRYTGSTYMLKQAVSAESMTRLEQAAQDFRKYSDRYGGLPADDGGRVSRIRTEQQAKSQFGAVGVMQVMFRDRQGHERRRYHPRRAEYSH
jgi:membrane-bound lytic murein transglycosylase MltF